jgi:hypothetical protein
MLIKFPHPNFHLHHHNLTNISSSVPQPSGERVESGKSNKTKPSSSSSRRTEDSHLVNERAHKSKSSSSKQTPHARSSAASSADKHKSGRKSSGATTATVVEGSSSSSHDHHHAKKHATKASMFAKKSHIKAGEALHYYNSNHPLHPMPSHKSASGGASSRSTSAQHHQSRIKSTDSGESKTSSSRFKSFEQSSSGSGSAGHLVSEKPSKASSGKHHQPKTKSKSVDKNSDFVHVQMVNPVPSGKGGDKKGKNKKRPSTESSSVEA